MAETKYGKYLLREPLGTPRHPEVEAQVIRIGQDSVIEAWNGVPFSITMEPIHQPFWMAKEGHTHDQDEILCFIGANPMDFRDFGAEVELYLGEEGEKHVITTTTFVYIPKGLVHCPLNFKRVDKPIVFSDILLAPLYYNKPV
jgi:hypothetical protein